jgi:hypothetical protein
MQIATKASKCRVCGGAGLDPLLALGDQKIANGFHDCSEEQIGAPLTLTRCTSCGLVQLEHSVDTNLMYKKYWYRSGINQTMRDHLKSAVTKIMSFDTLKAGDIVIDIGCNDGTLLSYYPDSIVKIGVDPSNIHPSNCIHINDYFTYDNVKEALGGKKAKVISSIAMFYDLNDPKAFVKDVRDAMEDGGLWVLEMSYLPRMIANAAYDSICHEHVTYYSMTTFMSTLDGTDFRVIDASVNDINGGSIRIVCSAGARSPQNIEEFISQEKRDGYSGPEIYKDFVNRVAKSKNDLISFFSEEKGKKIYGYGASTKGQIILQYCNLDASNMIAIAERNPSKYGLYTPGTNIRICPEQEMRDAKPDYLLIFPWYFFDEFKDRESKLHDGGCKFILPLPVFQTV